MDTKLIFYDMEIFLEKYTRFMTKNIYITDKIYECFMSQYQYLFQLLDKVGLLYDTNATYQKVMDVKKNAKGLVRLHNQKYLKKMVLEYQTFFDNLYSKDILDVSKRSMILCEEEKMLCVVKKNAIPLVIGKVEYWMKNQQILPDEILIVGNSEEELLSLRKYWNLSEKNVISIIDIEKEKLDVLEEEETLLMNSKKCFILKNYLTEILFPNTQKFNCFISNFSTYLYFHPDYVHFHNFSDYHDYLYQKKYVSSGLSLKKFNEKTIQKRKHYLRTICNESVETKLEVDVANFFYLNCIPYWYDKKTCSFSVYPDQKNYCVYVRKEEDKDFVSTLDAKREWVLCEKNDFEKSGLEVLIYELIKRRCPLEKREEEEIFSKLRETTKDSYFSEAISNFFLPAMEYYQEHGSFGDGIGSTSEESCLLEMFSYYQKYLEGNRLVDERVLLRRIEKKLQKRKYSRIVVLGDMDIHFSGNVFQVVSHLEGNGLLKENIKLFMEYQKYLQMETVIPISNVYMDMQEYCYFTRRFISDHLDVINQNLARMNKNIYVSFYEDKDKYLVHRNRVLELERLVLERGLSMVVVSKYSDINLLIEEGVFTKVNRETLKSKMGVSVVCVELEKLEKPEEKLVFPFFMEDKSYSYFVKRDNTLKNKMMLLSLLSKCKRDLYLICPESASKNVSGLLKGLKNVNITPKIPV